MILPRLAGSLGPLLLAAARGRRCPAAPPARIPELPGAAVGIVLAAQGYPGDPRRGDPIDGLDAAAAARARSSSTPGRSGGRRAASATNGGRVLTVVGPRTRRSTTARDAAERAADAIAWDGLQRRRDIARDLPIPAGVGA